MPSGHIPTGQAALTIHGYRIYNDDASPVRHALAWTFYDVPQLGVSVATYGALGTSILKTLAPSARKVALDPSYETGPNNWRAVSDNGIAASIPPSWRVDTLTTIGCTSRPSI